MNRVLPLFRRSILDGWRGLVGWTVGILIALFLYLPLYPSFGGNGQMQQISSDTYATRPEWAHADITGDFQDCRAALNGSDAACEWMFPLPGERVFLASIVAVWRPPRTLPGG